MSLNVFSRQDKRWVVIHDGSTQLFVPVSEAAQVADWLEKAGEDEVHERLTLESTREEMPKALLEEIKWQHASHPPEGVSPPCSCDCCSGALDAESLFEVDYVYDPEAATLQRVSTVHTWPAHQASPSVVTWFDHELPDIDEVVVSLETLIWLAEQIRNSAVLAAAQL